MIKTIKRLGAIGDIHAEDRLLLKAIQFLKTQNVDGIISVGDIADGIGCVNTCCDLLQKEKVITVAGNHDSWLLENTARDIPQATQLSELSHSSHHFLASLPKTRELETISGLLLLCHGLGEDDMACIMPTDYEYPLSENLILQDLLGNYRYRFIINGHSHFKTVHQIEPIIIINVGTLKWAHSNAGFAVIDFEQGYVQFYEFYDNGDSIEKAEYMSW